MSKAPNHSYGQILKSSSIIGGAQGINCLISMMRVKAVAVLLGPSGVGLVGLYVSATSLVGVLTGLGIGTSGVREVAEAHASEDAERVARTVITLRRACWVTGLLGWMLTIAFAYPLSLWTFGSGERSGAVALLGSTLLIGSIAGGQTALLQGTRRIGDIARLNVISVLVGSLVAVAIYACLGERGIVPVIIATALVNLGFSWWFAHRVKFTPLDIGWDETWRNSKRLFSLGSAFMWSGLISAIVALSIRSVIIRQLGIDASGIYQAAWGISVMFAGFILSAMGTDFYPRLTAAAHDNLQVNRLVNEQTEIGTLMALPGLVGILAFNPWVMRIFYSETFLPGAELLPWFVLGIFAQVVSWPMGCILAAKGELKWMVVTETLFGVVNALLCICLVRQLALFGSAVGFAITYGLYTMAMLWLSNRITGFSWSVNSRKLLTTSVIIISGSFAAQRWLTQMAGLAIGSLLIVGTCVVSLRGIASRLGDGHSMVRIACKIPGIRFVCGL